MTWLKNFLRNLSRSRFPYRPLITVEISRERILHNLAEFQKLNPAVPIAPVLKSNAYGHGLLSVAKILDGANHIPFLIIDSYFEALALRSESIPRPILVIGFTPAPTIAHSTLKNVSFTITGLETLRELSANAKKNVTLHLKFHTGMHRQGISPSSTDEALQLIKKNPHLILEGVLSHFADADSTDSTFTKSQIALWNTLVEKTLAMFPSLKYYHLSNTAGHAFGKEAKANISRLGLGLYGIRQKASVESRVAMLPALEIKTTISGIKNIAEGEKIGYNLTFTAPRAMRIATIPVGYFEGVDRRLSNKGFVKIRDSFAPIVGRVSMNITTIDVTEIPEASFGDSVMVISNNPSDKNSIETIATLCDTTPYEIPVHIPQHLLRVIV